MECNYSFSRATARNRNRIIDFLLHDANSPQAVDSFYQTLDGVVSRIRACPRLYAVSRLPTLARLGYRACFFHEYVLLYRYSPAKDGEGTVHIARILPANSDYAHIAQ